MKIIRKLSNQKLFLKHNVEGSSAEAFSSYLTNAITRCQEKKVKINKLLRLTRPSVDNFALIDSETKDIEQAFDNDELLPMNYKDFVKFATLEGYHLRLSNSCKCFKLRFDISQPFHPIEILKHFTMPPIVVLRICNIKGNSQIIHYFLSNCLSQPLRTLILENAHKELVSLTEYIPIIPNTLKELTLKMFVISSADLDNLFFA